MTLEEKIEFWSKFKTVKHTKILEENPNLKSLFKADWGINVGYTRIVGNETNKGIMFIHLFYKIANDAGGKD